MLTPPGLQIAPGYEGHVYALVSPVSPQRLCLCLPPLAPAKTSGFHR